MSQVGQAAVPARPSPSANNNNKKKNKNKKKKTNEPKEQPICHHYAATGQCSYGESCKFLHKRRRRDEDAPSSPPDPLDLFFAQYPTFRQQRSQPVWDEFRRLRGHMSWAKCSDEGDHAWETFRMALTEQFNAIYGTDEKDLAAWHRLCHLLGIVAPPTLEESRLLVRSIHVNLVDLVDSPRTGRHVKVFPTLQKLQEYTKETGKIFPKEEAYAGGLLRMLLREIFGSYQGNAKRSLASR